MYRFRISSLCAGAILVGMSIIAAPRGSLAQEPWAPIYMTIPFPLSPE